MTPVSSNRSSNLTEPPPSATILLVEETGVLGESDLTVASH
jgi:hypothetical protein